VSYPLFAVLAAMVFLSAQEVSRPVTRFVARKAPRIVDSPEWARSFPERVEAVNRAILESPLGAKLASQTWQGSTALRWPHRVFELTVDRQGKSDVEAAVGALRGVDPGLNLVVEETFNGSQILVGLDGLLTHTLRIYWADAPARPRVGLVLAALGDDLRVAHRVLDLDESVSVAILPFHPFSAEVAKLARSFGHEVLLDWTERASERRGLDAALLTVPGAIGIVFGSDVLSDEAQTLARERGLFSLHPDVRGERRATVFAISAGDGWDEAVDSVERRAREGGFAIAIADAADGDELDRLRALLGRWRQGQIEVVNVSPIVGEFARSEVARRPAE